ncbi:MAG: DNA-processing protein DprA [Eubacterium sp.]|nr:DNA-processing protein DprA [Eubacterium sp.]
MSDVRYWLWLQRALGTGAAFKPILEDFGSVEALYDANIFDLKMSPELNSKRIDKLESVKLDEVNETVEICKKNNWDIIGYDDERYPQRLREIYNPPAVLFVDGKLPRFDLYATIAIVGTRKASTYALQTAKIMSKGISLCGAITVSGGALGVDSAVHKGALEVNKPTVAVLGSGLGSDYLKSNEALRRSIVDGGGALITEYPPFAKANSFHFPERNRIISGLSLGVLVVEAGTSSGSVITANHAREQMRDIYAIPSSILDFNFAGTNNLIDSGATVATSPLRLIEKYADEYETLDLSKLPSLRELAGYKDKPEAYQENQIAFDRIKADRSKRNAITSKALELRGDEKAVYEALSEELKGIEEISEGASLDVRKTLSALTMLEIKGIIESAEGKRFKLK